VRLRRKVAAPDPLSASPAIVRTAPTVFVTGRPGKGNGSHFCSASVAESGAAKSSGGAGTRTAAPLSRVAAEVSGLSLMVRLHGNVNSVSMLSLPPQLLRALPWQAQVDQPFVRSNSARSPRSGLGMTRRQEPSRGRHRRVNRLQPGEAVGPNPQR
jgi:hypothetical protein